MDCHTSFEPCVPYAVAAEVLDHSAFIYFGESLTRVCGQWRNRRTKFGYWTRRYLTYTSFDNAVLR